MNAKPETVDFGAPATFGVHVFRVEIPPGRNAPVIIVEDYGYRGQERGIPREEERVVLERNIWSAIADIARREFNDRLKGAQMLTGRWHIGTNLIDRLLGKELCVLAWAAETATLEQILVICSKWAALRPEERWWLFSMTVAEAGLLGTGSEDGAGLCSTPFQMVKSRLAADSDPGSYNKTNSSCLYSRTQNEHQRAPFFPQGHPRTYREATTRAETLC